MLWKNECVSVENTERTAIYYGLRFKNTTSEKKVYFIIVFQSLLSMFYTQVLLCTLFF